MPPPAHIIYTIPFFLRETASVPAASLSSRGCCCRGRCHWKRANTKWGCDISQKDRGERIGREGVVQSGGRCRHGCGPEFLVGFGIPYHLRIISADQQHLHLSNGVFPSKGRGYFICEFLFLGFIRGWTMYKVLQICFCHTQVALAFCGWFMLEYQVFITELYSKYNFSLVNQHT